MTDSVPESLADGLDPSSSAWSDAPAVLALWFIALVLRAYKLGSVPGGDFDEAHFGLFLDWVRAGHLSLLFPRGVFVGVLYPLLNFPFVALLGQNFLALRLSGLVFNGFALVFLYLFLRRAHSHRAGLIGLALWGTSPIVVMLQRKAWEITALLPILYFAALLLVTCLPRRRALAIPIVLLFAAAMYSHASFVNFLVPATASAFIVFVYPRLVRRWPRVHGVVRVTIVVVAALAAPACGYLMLAGAPRFVLFGSHIACFLMGWMPAGHFLQMTGIFRHFAPPLTLAFGIAAALATPLFWPALRLRLTDPQANLLRWSALAFLLALVCTGFTIPAASLRYFLYAGVFMSLTAAAFWATVLAARPRLLRAALVLLVAINTASLYLYLFRPYARNVIRPARFGLLALVDSSYPQMPTDDLYRFLEYLAVKDVFVAPESIRITLGYHDHADHALTLYGNDPTEFEKLRPLVDLPETFVMVTTRDDAIRDTSFVKVRASSKKTIYARFAEITPPTLATRFQIIACKQEPAPKSPQAFP